MTPKNRTMSVIGKSAVALLAVASGTGSAAHAGVLLGSPITTTVGPGTATATAVTTTPNNFPTQTPNDNTVTMSTTFTGIGSVDSVLQGVNSKAGNSTSITEYRFIVTTTDNTSSAFNSLVFQIGTGTGANFAPLTGSPTFAGDFAFPASIASSTGFLRSIQSSTSLTFDSGPQAAGSSDRETFTLAVPDQGATPFTFTLRETPTASPVPEASSVVSFGLLLAFGAGGLCLTARRRKSVK